MKDHRQFIVGGCVAIGVAILTGITGYYFGSRNSLAIDKQTQTQHSYNLPTATEVFNLRSQCAALGQKILDNNAVGSALTQSQNTYYNPVTNRCFVELTTQSADLSGNLFSDYLYDGQTENLLASVTKNAGKKAYGNIFGGPTEPTNPDYSDDSYNSTSYYIGEVMNDDWRQ
jgi:hypothetical protein